MRKIRLGKSGLEVSAVGFGGIPIQRITGEEAVRLIRSSIELGVTFFDTASGYGDSQAKIGRATENAGGGVVLATKSSATTRDGVIGHIENSLREMRTESIDLFQFHNISSDEKWGKINEAGGSMEGVLEAREKGYIKHIGFTSHSLEYALKLADEEIMETVQFPFNLVTSEPAEELIPKARKNNLGFIAMKPLCGGQYSDARLAFKFFNGFPDIVPIPGIETFEEIREITRISESGERLAGEELRKARDIASQLGKLFCRRCGYCEPCPRGVPVSILMVFDGIVKRLPPEKAGRTARQIIEKKALCIECGECERKCPYGLPIQETMKKAEEKAAAVLDLV